MSKVCVLQHINCETPGLIGVDLRRAGVAFEIINSHAGVPVPETVAAYDGLLVMGGPQSVNEQDKFPFLRQELRLIESALAAHKPILGICLGSQLLASALGARVSKAAKKEIGWYPVKLTPASKQDALWSAAPQTFTAYHWHGDIFDLPADAVALASSDQTACQAFRHGTNAYGMLFHMEISEPIIGEMVMMFADELHHAGVDARQIITGARKHLPALHAVGGPVFANWAKLVTAKPQG